MTLKLVHCRRYGFFNNKRIVLFDTLIKECSEEEVVAVLAHGELHTRPRAWGLGWESGREGSGCQPVRDMMCTGVSLAAYVSKGKRACTACVKLGLSAGTR